MPITMIFFWAPRLRAARRRYVPGSLFAHTSVLRPFGTAFGRPPHRWCVMSAESRGLSAE
jgi:hypothetical protein